MKQLYSFLYAALLCPLFAIAQTDFSTFDAPVRIVDEIIPAVSSDGDLCLYSYRSGSAFFSTVNASGQHIATIEHPITFKAAPEIAGALPLPDQFVFFRREILEDVELLQPVSIDKATGTIEVLPEIKLALDPASTFLQAFDSDGKFYALYFSKKTNNLQVCVFRNAQEHVVKRIPLTLSKMDKRLFSGSAPLFVDEQLPVPIATASNHKKIYLRGEKMLLILDGFGASSPNDKHKITTDIVELDLAAQTAHYSQLPFINNTRPVDMNSILHNNTLFRYQMSNKSISLSAYELPTLQLKRQYTYELHDPVTLKATPVFRNGGKNKYPYDTATIEPTSKVLRKMTTGNAFVLVEESATNTLQLSLGAYQTGISGSGGAMPSGIPLVTAFGAAALPAVIALSAYRIHASYNPSLATTHFKTSLEKQTLGLADIRPAQGLWDEADKYSALLEEQETALGGVIVYPYQQDQLHYVVLDRATKKFRIVTLKSPQIGMNPSN
ncbi:hypothetical protein [Pontibacter ramchanderi]|uniref:Uncharacterized protein n=1 Tax=Pontibacter ramchanderi TaxID=1179743 RepID=A0A2N3UCI9_9BACT|nr:hypothetical protein [Pontibacter ramchanderi]PKV67052.1 hypothetical protein BD749_2191 [Pontibacter ramchanderi]